MGDKNDRVGTRKLLAQERTETVGYVIDLGDSPVRP
ncbi:hypothetical protein MPTA5024_24675 [Microbispora sp. ATCC PTA-5024]|nr:hypothetical protein MPTA5024_24675 [Microbispora sp. ATCC PTA-5024]